MTTNALPTVNELDFDQAVLHADKPVLVDFTAVWCSPCRALKPLLNELAAETSGRLDVVAVDADESPTLATRFGVRGFPTLLLFSGGREVARSVGLCSRAQLRRLVASVQAA
jgi:thioredoxin 1